MSIETLFRVKCTPCERYLAADSKVAIADSSASPLFLTFTSAYEEAVRRGWSASPLLCHDCAADLVQRVKEGA